MSLPFEIRFDRNVFKTALICSLAGIFLMVSVTAMNIIFEGYFFKALSNWKFLKVFIPQIEMISIFLIPIFVAAFIRPVSRKKKHLILQGSIVLFVSSVVYLAIVTYLPKLSVYPYDDRGIETNIVLLSIFLMINLALYAPPIFKQETSS